MPPVFFARFCPMRSCARPNDEFRSGEPIPCYGEAIPCFAAEQGTASKALRGLREMTVRRGKTVKKDPKFAKFPVLFPVFRESAVAGDKPGGRRIRGRGNRD